MFIIYRIKIEMKNGSGYILEVKTEREPEEYRAYFQTQIQGETFLEILSVDDINHGFRTSEINSYEVSQVYKEYE